MRGSAARYIELLIHGAREESVGEMLLQRWGMLEAAQSVSDVGGDNLSKLQCGVHHPNRERKLVERSLELAAIFADIPAADVRATCIANYIELVAYRVLGSADYVSVFLRKCVQWPIF